VNGDGVARRSPENVQDEPEEAKGVFQLYDRESALRRDRRMGSSEQGVVIVLKAATRTRAHVSFTAVRGVFGPIGGDPYPDAGRDHNES